ncbi:MAG: TIGR03619 family F420-dependent LLM class oxidoreductase [Gammaproteobacteria bacterium]|nr:TIGR03619 family F420-dependent LLM class oxidoreductase [Gammaproteobacteria bacterium]
MLPQRQPVLVAKQVSTLDTLSGGRVRLGVGVGWQAAEYEALSEDFANRGQRMDEAIVLLRHCWQDARVGFDGEFYRTDAIAMEPKPPRGAIPVWIGGNSPRALRRVGELGDGWLATAYTDLEDVRRARAVIDGAAQAADRDPAEIGYQMMIDVPPRDASGKAFYQDMDRVAARAEFLREAGFQWGAVNATAIFQAGHAPWTHSSRYLGAYTIASAQWRAEVFRLLGETDRPAAGGRHSSRDRAAQPRRAHRPMAHGQSGGCRRRCRHARTSMVCRRTADRQF